MPALPGLAAIAYMLGVRHAFDVDHIAAIDNATRRLCGRRRGPSATGFFFSLGHSSVVLVAVAVVATAVHASAGGAGALPALGGMVGGAASAAFLWAIGLANLAALLGRRSHRHAPAPRGFLTALLGPVFRRVTAEWHMYVVGAAFGLGFDTAGEVGLLALAASPGTASLAAVVALPLLFAAGMSLFDTLDGVLIGYAYRWSATDHRRRHRYVTTMTAVSAGLALAVGTFEATQLLPGFPSAALPSVTESQSQLGGIALTAVLALVWVVHAARENGRSRHAPGEARAGRRRLRGAVGPGVAGARVRSGQGPII